jgi:hypothetical protein
MTKKALLDACTIFGMPIKDTLFTAAPNQIAHSPIDCNNISDEASSLPK